MTSFVFDSFTEWLVALIGRLAGQAVEQLLAALLESTTRVSFVDGWWVEPRARALAEVVLALAAGSMVAFLLLAAVQGLLAGEPGMTVRAVVVEAPVSVFGMVVLGGVATLLLDATDAAAALVLGGGDEVAQALRTLAAPAAITPLTGVLLGLFSLGAFLVWVELVVREALLYLLIALAPLMLAARVWPAARGAWRKTVEVGLALTLSKFVVALALQLGAVMVNTGARDGVDLAGLLGGTVLLFVAAFMTYTLFRLFDVVAESSRAQGISGAPFRAAMQAAQTGYYLRGLRGLGGGGTEGSSQGAPAGSPADSSGSRALPAGQVRQGLAHGRRPPELGPGPRAIGPGGPDGGGPPGPDPQGSGPSGPPAPAAGGGPGASAFGIPPPVSTGSGTGRSVRRSGATPSGSPTPATSPRTQRGDSAGINAAPPGRAALPPPPTSMPAAAGRRSEPPPTARPADAPRPARQMVRPVGAPPPKPPPAQPSRPPLPPAPHRRSS